MAVLGLLTRQGWWQPVLLAAAVVSLVIIALDWQAAKWGALVNALILVAMAASPLAPRSLAELLAL